MRVNEILEVSANFEDTSLRTPDYYSYKGYLQMQGFCFDALCMPELPHAWANPTSPMVSSHSTLYIQPYIPRDIPTTTYTDLYQYIYQPITTKTKTRTATKQMMSLD